LADRTQREGQALEATDSTLALANLRFVMQPD
jgi:hypothetical protein